jgi:hypothetical protein
VNDCPCGLEPRRPGQRYGLACHRAAQRTYRALDAVEPPAPGEATITVVVRVPESVAVATVAWMTDRLPGYGSRERVTIRRHGRRPEHWRFDDD